MIKSKLTKVAAFALAISTCAPLAAVPKHVPIPVPVPVPVPVPADPPRHNPPPPRPRPAPQVHIEVHPSKRREIRIEGRLRIRRYHGRDTVFLEAYDGDYFLYPDDFSRHPLTWDDFEYFDGEYVEVEGYVGPGRDEITVYDIHRVHRSNRIR